MPPRPLRMVLTMSRLLRARTLILLVNPDRATTPRPLKMRPPMKYLPRMSGLTLDLEQDGVMDHFAMKNLWHQLTTLN
ncbi:hypothetical protein B0H16DRAFT_1577718, partial [Mycena metata]